MQLVHKKLTIKDGDSNMEAGLDRDSTHSPNAQAQTHECTQGTWQPGPNEEEESHEKLFTNSRKQTNKAFSNKHMK